MKSKKDKVETKKCSYEYIHSGMSWKKILHDVYINAPHYPNEPNKLNFSEDKHPIAKRLKISGAELVQGIIFFGKTKFNRTNK